MVLEALVNPLSAERKPSKMILYGFVYSTVAVFLSMWIFRENASLVMVFLTTLASVPLMYGTVKIEEQKDETITKESLLLKEHGRALSFFIFMFIGMVLSFVLWYVVLPSEIVNSLFKIQTETIAAINGNVTGSAVRFSLFSKIFLNNLKVLIFCLLFAFVYGVGALFILTWNASVIGAAIGNFIRGEIAKYAGAVGMVKVSTYFNTVSIGLLRYAIHGIPEILAYFTAGLAASIISIAMMRHHLDFERFKKVVLDSVDLIVLSIAILFIAALLEVYVTPIFF